MFLKSNYLIISLFLSLILSCTTKNITNEEIYGTLDIPKINLEATIYNKESEYNQLKYGLYLLPESSSLDNKNSHIIIASHSGTAKISHFKNLDQLELNDEIKIIIKKEIYLFKVINIYEEEKDGIIDINKYNTKTLSLITCKKNTNDLQIIISAVYTGKLEKI